MANVDLAVIARAKVGKGISRTLRREAMVPAVVYGRGMEPCPISVDPKALLKSLDPDAGWNTLLTLKGDGPFDGKRVIVKEMQLDPIRRSARHIDFHAVDLTSTVTVQVPLVPVGKSQGEIEGGNLEIIRHEIEVSCLPTEIPGSIEVDVTALNVGDVLHIADIKCPEGVEIPYDINFTVITCTGHKEEVEDVEEGEEGIEVTDAAEGEPEEA